MLSLKPSKGMGITCMIFVVSSPEVMGEADTDTDAVVENLLKVWGILACSLLLRVQSAHDNLKFKLKG